MTGPTPWRAGVSFVTASTTQQPAHCEQISASNPCGTDVRYGRARSGRSPCPLVSIRSARRPRSTSPARDLTRRRSDAAKASPFRVPCPISSLGKASAGRAWRPGCPPRFCSAAPLMQFARGCSDSPRLEGSTRGLSRVGKSPGERAFPLYAKCMLDVRTSSASTRRPSDDATRPAQRLLTSSPPHTRCCRQTFLGRRAWSLRLHPRIRDPYGTTREERSRIMRCSVAPPRHAAIPKPTLSSRRR